MLKKIINSKYYKEIFKGFTITALCLLPIVIYQISTMTKYNDNTKVNEWILAVLISTFIVIMIYKSFYMPNGFKFRLLNKDLIIVLVGLTILKSGLHILSYLNDFKNSLNQSEWNKIWLAHQDQLHFFIIENSIVAPIIEEFLFRGCIYFGIYKLINEIMNHYNWDIYSNKTKYIINIIFILVSSLTFASVHLTDSFITMLPYIFAGLTFSIIYVLTKNLLITILIHSLNNFTAFFKITEISTYKLLVFLIITTLVIEIFIQKKQRFS